MLHIWLKYLASFISYTEEERQLANQRGADRKPKTGIKALSVHITRLAVGLARCNEEQDRTEARILSDIIDYNVKPMENKNLVTLQLCWTSLTINQDSPTLTLVKKTTGKKDKAIKEEIK